MRVDKFVDSLSGQLTLNNRYRMRQICRSVLHRLGKYCEHRYPSLDAVYRNRFLRGFQEYLLSEGLSRNTVTFYMTALRSIYTFAVKDGRLPADPELFSFAGCGHVPTHKRALSPRTVAILHAADLSDVPRLERCRDLFMLSLYLQGMPFIDLAYLRKSDVHAGYIAYSRRKTGGVICVSIIESAQNIFDKYADETSDSPYLLPLITLSGEEGHKQYESALRRHNRQLKDLAAHLDITETLSSYVSRHCWATIAYHHGVEVGVVSQGMGHHTEEITRFYLSSFARDRLTEANRVVLRAILLPIQEGLIKNIREEVKQEIVRELGDSGSLTNDATETENTIRGSSEYEYGNRFGNAKIRVFRFKPKNVRLYGKDGR